MADVRDLLSIEKAVLQGAMGGVSRHDLVVAVSEAGGLGTLGYLPPAQYRLELERLHESLGRRRPYAANLLLPIVGKEHHRACLELPVPIVTLFFGLDRQLLSALKEAGKLVLVQVGDVSEARRVFEAGADGVIVQGHQAGGHLRGSQRLEDVLPEVRETFPDRVVCGAGGIHDRSSAAACRSLGADAVCSGTRFLMTPQASAHDAYKRRLVAAQETVVTQLFGVGWRDPHRVLVNRAVERWCDPSGREPAWLNPTHKLTALASKVSSRDGGAAMTRRQTVRLPFFTPNALLPEFPGDLVDVVALYAGECVASIDDLREPALIIDELA